MEEKLVLPTVNFTRFGKLVSPTVNFTRFGKLVSVKAIPISLTPQNSSQSQFLGEMKLKIKKTNKKKTIVMTGGRVGFGGISRPAENPNLFAFTIVWCFGPKCLYALF